MRGVLLVALLLGGCVSTEATQATVQSRWLGQPLDAFVIAHGPPTSTYAMGDGRRVVEWQDSHGTMPSTIAVLGGASVEDGGAKLVCKIRMVISRGGTIEQVTPVKDTIGNWQLSRCREVLG